MSFIDNISNDIGIDQTSGDLACEKGDFVVASSNDCHVADIIIAEQGCFKFRPTLGAGIMRLICAPNDYLTKTLLERQISINLRRDDFQIRRLSIDNLESGKPNISIDAYKTL